MDYLNLNWARTNTDFNFVNFGDALSPIIVAGLSNMPVQVVSRNSSLYDKLSAIGTIGQNLINGVNNIWGTGFDASISPINAKKTRYKVPDNTYFNILATRGRFSELLLKSQGISVPGIYGDPGWFAKYLVSGVVKKKYELGIIVHITELEEAHILSSVKKNFKRYIIPKELNHEIKIINTYADRSVDGVLDKIREIKSCKRVLSTSLHGLIMAEIFNIPCAWFGLSEKKGIKSPIYVYDNAMPIDHRFRDFYSGTSSHDYVLTYHSLRHEYCNYDEAISFLDNNWLPVEFDEVPLFQAFPYLNISHPSLMDISKIKQNLNNTIL